MVQGQVKIPRIPSILQGNRDILQHRFLRHLIDPPTPVGECRIAHKAGNAYVFKTGAA